MPSVTQPAPGQGAVGRMSAGNSGSQDLPVHPEATRSISPCFHMICSSTGAGHGRSSPAQSGPSEAAFGQGCAGGCAWKFSLCQEPAGGSDSAQQQLPGDALPSHSVRVPSTGGPTWPPKASILSPLVIAVESPRPYEGHSFGSSRELLSSLSSSLSSTAPKAQHSHGQ